MKIPLSDVKRILEEALKTSIDMEELAKMAEKEGLTLTEEEVVRLRASDHPLYVVSRDNIVYFMSLSDERKPQDNILS